MNRRDSVFSRCGLLVLLAAWTLTGCVTSKGANRSNPPEPDGGGSEQPSIQNYIGNDDSVPTGSDLSLAGELAPSGACGGT
jgi:hypothetical protein